ncbi:helix-turn-helix domain-containing protein [Actinomycetospora sp. NBRC 106378]|uniref:winged helix-turn-helix transcriptional regulator n=1 Tax=Actinomycetospora sp. NBRC 106378 TaxID=3032208 RepID=UPI0024A4486F|nr:helix-turn-helix domain-containing protein [Actinomycetospora sp. NBRC 106378]GLZ53479.1 transcriptional regulator [Actinomycetospora sp. NBRC 106378]
MSTSSAPTRTYGQMCPLARSLDVLGERWTLLVVRELLLGPKRFKHLLASLPGIGSNRLSMRLTTLEDAGAVRRATLPEPASVPVYELTEEGERLRGPVVGLALWGLQLPLDERVDPGTIRAELIALCLTHAPERAPAAHRDDVVEFHVGREVFHLRMAEGRVLPRSGPSPVEPTARVESDLATFLALALRELTPSGALASGRATVASGPPSALAELFDVLALPPQGPIPMP